MDTNPGYALSSTGFSVKFVCAQQKKVVSYLLEYETDWYDMMEIILSRLEDEPADQDKFQATCFSDRCLPIVRLFHCCCR